MATLVVAGNENNIVKVVCGVILKGQWDTVLKTKIGTSFTSTVVSQIILKLSPFSFGTACSFFEWAEFIPDYKHSPQSNWTMICILTKHKYFNTAHTMLEKIAIKDFLSRPQVLWDVVDVSYDSEVNSEVLSMLVTFYAKSKMTPDAIQVFEYTWVRGFKISVRACTVLLNSLAKDRLADTVWKLFKKMIKSGLVPNLHIYNVLIHACCKFGDVKKAEQFLSEDEMMIDEGLGYPKAYSKICRDRSSGPFRNGPPFYFIPFALPEDEVMRVKKMDEMFPIINQKAKPTTKPEIFLSLLWKQLSHLGNAGFDPEMFRVDAYRNVLYYHADPASPLAWDIDHWFLCSRGGFTVPSNLRVLQWQVCRNKQDQLEFLLPWWELQVGVSINQFLSIFVASNSDFRHRAFSWLFSGGESEELNSSQTVDSHSFPQHFKESKDKIGLAPAAIVLTKREQYASSSLNRRPRSSTPIIAVSNKIKSGLKENEDPNMKNKPYQEMVLARDSLRQRDQSSKMLAEIKMLDDEIDETKMKTEDEKLTIQELESVLMKRKRRAEKCRRLAEAQSSYRSILEKMIRDAMH